MRRFTPCDFEFFRAVAKGQGTGLRRTGHRAGEVLHGAMEQAVETGRGGDSFSLGQNSSVLAFVLFCVLFCFRGLIVQFIDYLSSLALLFAFRIVF